MLVRIRNATPIGGHRLRLGLSDGSVTERDVGALLLGPLFRVIRTNTTDFAAVHVVDGALAWPNGVELCPDAVLWGGLPPADVSDRVDRADSSI
jgi:hypothetical protein